MSVDRRREIRDLEAHLASGNAQLIRVYGRRRIGKTELLRRLAERHGGLHLVAFEADRPQQLASLARQVAQQTQGLRLPFEDWDDFLDAVEASQAPLLVLDEFQRLLESDRQAATRLQARWDAKWRTSGPPVVLCGSSIGMMQRLTASRRGPLFGRIGADLRLHPFRYGAARQLYEGLEEAERVRRFAVFGGTPFYHSFSVGRDLDDALRRSFLDTTAPFREEPQELLRLELKAATRYNSILYEVGQGARTLADLQNRVGVRPGGLGPYLETLENDLDILAKDDPVAGLKKKARYRLADPFFEFYFRFIFGNRPRLELGRMDAVLAEIREGLDGHVGRIFERVATDVLIQANGTRVGGHRLDFDEVGAWWNRSGDEIDLVAKGPSEIWALEVKWSNRPVQAAVWHELRRKSQLIERRDGLPIRLGIVSRTGVTPTLKAEMERAGGVVLSLEDLADLSDANPL